MTGMGVGSGEAYDATVILDPHAEEQAEERARAKRLAAVAYYEREIDKAKSALDAAEQNRAEMIAAGEAKVAHAVAELATLEAGLADAQAAVAADGEG